MPYLFGQAVSDVPSQDGVYTFIVLQMEVVKGTVGTSVYYRLVPKMPAQTVTATNSQAVKVRQGNKVMLTLMRSGYDIFMDCTDYRTAIVVEPCLPMLMPLVQPNFAGTDGNGKPYSLEGAYRSLSYRNALCAGTLAIEGKRYYPIQATYRGGERYYDQDGNIQYRMPGDPQRTWQGEPVYLMRRELVHTAAGYFARKDNANQQSVSSGNVPKIQGYLDSPYMYQYVDGSPCSIGLPPTVTQQLAQSEWALTTDITKAQFNYDLFLCPKQAEGEPIPPNTLVSIVAERVTTYKHPLRNKYGEEIDPDSGVVQTTDTRYFEVLPPTNSYFTKIKGQVKTYGFVFITNFAPLHDAFLYPTSDLIVTKEDMQDKTVYSRRCYPNVYANALLDDYGRVEFHHHGKVVNIRQYFPCRGVFRLKTHDTLFDVLFSLRTERGYGVPCVQRYPRFVNHRSVDEPHAVYYTIVRRLADPQTGKYVLEIQPTMPYLSNGELEAELNAVPNHDD